MGMEISSGQPINVGGNGMGGDWGIMFLAFLAMLGGGFGAFGGNRGPMMQPMTGDQAPASSAQLQNSMNFNDLQDQNRDINNNVNNIYHDLNNSFMDKYSELQRDIAANAVTLQQVQFNSQQCCCQIKQEMAAQTLKFSEMMNAQNMFIVQENQKTRDLFQQDRFERMQAEINDLKRQRDINAALNARMPLPPPFPAVAGF